MAWGHGPCPCVTLPLALSLLGPAAGQGGIQQTVGSGTQSRRWGGRTRRPRKAGGCPGPGKGEGSGYWGGPLGLCIRHPPLPATNWRVREQGLCYPLLSQAPLLGVRRVGAASEGPIQPPSPWQGSWQQ